MRLNKCLLIGGVVSLLTLSAFFSYPVFDDGWLELLVKQWGHEGIREHLTDRPLVAIIWTTLSKSGLLMPVGLISHFLFWSGVVFVTMRLYEELLPESDYSLLAGLFSVAPVLVNIQIIIHTIMLTSIVGVVLSYIALLLLLRKKLIPLAFILIIFSTLLSEYSLPVVGIAIVLLLARERSQRQIVTSVALVIVSVTTYLIYHALANPLVRESVRPENQFSLWRVKWIPVRILTNIWQGSMGEVFSTLGSINFNSKVGLIGLVAGIVFTVILLFVIKTEPVTERHKVIGLFLLIALLAVGLFPIIVMGRVPMPGPDSRFWLPVLPVCSIITVYLLKAVLQKRVIVLTVCGFLIGYSTATYAISNIIEKRRIESWSHQIEPHLNGMTVIIFENGFDSIPRDYEITARLSKNWSVDKTNNFWAFADLEQMKAYSTGIDFSKIENPSIKRNSQGVMRKGAINKVLFVTVKPDGSLSVFPY